MPRPGLKPPKNNFTENRDTVTPIQRDCRDVEDAQDSRVGSETDEIDGDAPEDADPDCQDGSAGEGHDGGPEVGEWYQAIPRESKDGAAEGLHGGEGDEFDDHESAEGEDDAAGFAEDVEEDLPDGLFDAGGEDGVDVAHAWN